MHSCVCRNNWINHGSHWQGNTRRFSVQIRNKASAHSQSYRRPGVNIDYPIFAQLNDVQFVNDEMASNWFDSDWPVYSLNINTKQLHAIHANAFNQTAFKNLSGLMFSIKYHSLVIHDGALNGLSRLITFHLEAKSIRSLPSGIFDNVGNIISIIAFFRWPNNLSLKDIFGSGKFANINLMQIKNVEFPQTKFRHLAADNFTSFRRIEKLFLSKCGIEVIDGRTFNGLAKGLRYINLDENRIKFIDVTMFRLFLESNYQNVLRTINNPLECTCRLMELDIMLCPLREDPGPCVPCWATNSFDPLGCGIYREVNFKQLSIRRDEKKIMRIVSARLAQAGDSIAIATNFTSRFRVLFVDLNATMAHQNNCTARAAPACYACLSTSELIVDRWHLDKIGHLRHAALLSITAIPILSRFGAFPLHSMTIKLEVRAESSFLITLVPIVVGAIIGFVAGFCFQTFRPSQTALDDEQNGKRPSYSYAIPMYDIVPAIEPYTYDDVPRDHDEYIEMEDTGYVAVHL